MSALMTDKEIARSLGISPETVDKHMRAAFAKLGVSDRKSALRRLALDAPYAPDAVSDGARPGQASVVAPTPVGKAEDEASAPLPNRTGPYELFGLTRTPKTSGSLIWLVLKRAVVWMVVIAAGVAVMQMVLGLFDRLA